MDEITIEDKKYISAKRAAQETGYAKDYVGQLCREGRISARLVGRNWYVLESAIQDHRFGIPAQSNPAPTKAPEEHILPPTWESVRYESEHADELPTLNRLGSSGETIETNEIEGGTPPYNSENIENAWQNWFKAKEDSKIEDVLQIEPEEPVENEDIPVVIHSIYHPPLIREEELLPLISKKEVVMDIVPAHEGIPEELARHEIKAASSLVLRLGLVFIALASLSLAALSTGYFDTYALSYRPVSMLAGVSFYNK